MGIFETFSAYLARRPEPPLQAVPDLSMHGPPRDDDFVSTLDLIEGVDIEGLAVGIAYRDASGTPSVRTIRCHAAYRDGSLVYLHAWCLHRQDWRTFRLDRIEEVYDYTTGELLGPSRPFFAPLLGIASGPDRRSRPISDAAAAKTFRDGARVLLFIAMGDGRLDSREVEVIVKFGTARVRGAMPAFDGADRATRSWIGNQVPSRKSALAGLRTAMTDDVYMHQIVDGMIDVINADGHVNDDEMDAAWAIVKAMERAERRG